MKTIFATVSLVLFCQTCLVFGQADTVGQCVQVPMVQNFDVQRYLGRWYGYKSYSNTFQQNSTCNTIDYTDSTPPCCRTRVSVLNRSLNSTDGTIGNATGVAHLADPNNPAKPASFIVNFYEPVSKEFQVDPNYNVIKTDYESYSIVYSCRPKDCNTKTEFLWVLSRVRQPADPTAMDTMIYQTLQGLAIDATRLTPVAQAACPEELNHSATDPSANPVPVAPVPVAPVPVAPVPVAPVPVAPVPVAPVPVAPVPVAPVPVAPAPVAPVPVAPVPVTPAPVAPLPIASLLTMGPLPLVSFETIEDKDSDQKRHKWTYLRNEKSTWEHLTRL